MSVDFSAEDLVAVIYSDVFESAISSTVELMSSGPPGREPRPDLVELHEWFSALDGADREMIVRALTHAADAAVFGLLAMIDGVRVISDGARFGLKLAITDGDQDEVVGGDSGGEDLHDIFRGIVDNGRSQ